MRAWSAAARPETRARRPDAGKELELGGAPPLPHRADAAPPWAGGSVPLGAQETPTAARPGRDRPSRHSWGPRLDPPFDPVLQQEAGVVGGQLVDPDEGPQAWASDVRLLSGRGVHEGLDPGVRAVPQACAGSGWRGAARGGEAAPASAPPGESSWCDRGRTAWSVACTTHPRDAPGASGTPSLRYAQSWPNQPSWHLQKPC